MKIIGPWFVQELEQLKVAGLRYDVMPVPAADGVTAERRVRVRRPAEHRRSSRRRGTRTPPRASSRTSRRPTADRLLIEEASQLPYRRGLATDPRFTAALARWPTLSTYATYVERTRDSISTRTWSRSSTCSPRRTRQPRSTARCPSGRRWRGGRRSEEDHRCALKHASGMAAGGAVRGVPARVRGVPDRCSRSCSCSCDWDLVTRAVVRGTRQRAAARAGRALLAGGRATRSSSSPSTCRCRSSPRSASRSRSTGRSRSARSGARRSSCRS